MFHFAMSRFQVRDAVPHPQVEPDPALAKLLEKAWREDTKGQLAADLYPLRNAIVYGWSGDTPSNFDMCKLLIEQMFKAPPLYIWIGDEEREYREGSAFDFS